MALQIKTIRGHKYVYDVKSYRDKDTKKVKKKTTYMGPLIDEKTKEYKPKSSKNIKTSDREILNHGDTYILNESLKKSEISASFDEILPEEQDTLKALIFHKIIVGEAHKDAKNWFDGNYAKVLFPTASLESQRISETLSKLGNEQVQRKFFKHYLKNVAKISDEVIIDSTGMENEIDVPLTEFSAKNGHSQKETRLIMVVDRLTHMPLYFRLVAGNIVDVFTLTTTFSLMNKFGVNPQMVLMDAGYYSENNIRSLFQSNTSFLTRLPAGRLLYKKMITETEETLTNPENIVVYNKRSLYIQKVKTEICGYIGYAYVCCDIKQHGQRMDKFIRKAKEDKLTNAEISREMPYIGKFVLVSNKEIDLSELLPLYFTRQVAENTFGFSKSTLNLLPLRVHSLQNMRGYVFLSHLALLLSIEIQHKLKGLCTLHEALALGANHFCEVFGCVVVPLELNKRLKEVLKRLDVVVVNSSGV